MNQDAQPFAFTALSVLRLEPSDTLVVQYAHPITEDFAVEIRKMVESILPDGTRVLVHGSDFSLSVLRAGPQSIDWERLERLA